MSTKVAELQGIIGYRDASADWVGNLWTTYNNQRQGKIEEWKELRNFLFATDTSTTSNSELPWKNKTTLPKLCQIRDNLHSNYLSSLFPNEDWVRWEGDTQEDSIVAKRRVIESYMKNKTRSSHFRTTMSKLLYDYIDYGNAFVTVDFVSKYKEEEDEKRTPDYVGPVARRISPLDVVFNPLADSFVDSFKIVRSVKTIGEMVLMAEEYPEDSDFRKAVVGRLEAKHKLIKGGYTKEDFAKAEGFQMDGFGNFYEYLMSDYVELLEFYGDYTDPESSEVKQDRRIVIMDRCHEIVNEKQKSWFGHAPIYHVGWRFRPDNLWAMGPLDNLVGMQYRIDHLENLKADAMDLAIHPPLKIMGEVEEFEYGPGSEIFMDEGGDVQELGKNIGAVMAADTSIDLLEARMEMYAGAPREAMGVRSPGEKTAFEVQRLENASGRIFQEKISTFEIELLEPCLNAMLESSRRNLDASEVIRALDPDQGISQFLKVTREDITASGKLRPIGARHFAAQAQLIQNLTGIFNSPIGQTISPHVSSKAMARLVEDSLGLGRFDLFKPNVAVSEQMETQELAGQMQEDAEVDRNSGV